MEKREEANAALRYEATYYRKLAIVQNAVQLTKRAFCCEWPQKCGASGQVLSNGTRVLHFPDIFFTDCSSEFICSWPVRSARSVCNQRPPRGGPFLCLHMLKVWGRVLGIGRHHQKGVWWGSTPPAKRSQTSRQSHKEGQDVLQQVLMPSHCSFDIPPLPLTEWI